MAIPRGLALLHLFQPPSPLNPPACPHHPNNFVPRSSQNTSSLPLQLPLFSLQLLHPLLCNPHLLHHLLSCRLHLHTTLGNLIRELCRSKKRILPPLVAPKNKTLFQALACPRCSAARAALYFTLRRLAWDAAALCSFRSG